jgi:hypothetical protein
MNIRESSSNSPQMAKDKLAMPFAEEIMDGNAVADGCPQEALLNRLAPLLSRL